jgi:hypothetical protein
MSKNAKENLVFLFFSVQLIKIRHRVLQVSQTFSQNCFAVGAKSCNFAAEMKTFNKKTS